MSVSSLEINSLILQYLRENNMILSYKAIQFELKERYETEEISRITNNENSPQVPFGMLVNLIQKGILYSQLETISSNTNATTKELLVSDKVYSLQQLFEDNQDKLLYATNESELSGRSGKKRKNSTKDNSAANSLFSKEEIKTTYSDIEQEYKHKFTDLFNEYERKQTSIKSRQNGVKNTETKKEPKDEYETQISKNISPVIKYSASNFATISGSSLLTAAKQPSRETGFLSSINLAELSEFKPEEDVLNIKMCKTIRKTTTTAAATAVTTPTGNSGSTVNDASNVNNNIQQNSGFDHAFDGSNSISLNPLQNKDLLLFHLQNASASSVTDEVNVKEEEIALFNQPTSTLIQINESNTLFASCLEDGDILLYSLPENKLLAKLSMHKVSIISCKFSESGEYLLSVDVNGNIILWDLSTYNILKIFESNQQISSSQPAGIDCLFIDNTKFMIPIKDESNMNYVGVFEINTSAAKKTVLFLGKLKSSSSTVLSMSIFSKLKLLITSSDDNKIRIYKGKNLSLPTKILSLDSSDDSILDIYTNEIEENIFLVSAITLKGCMSNWIVDLKTENKDESFSVFTCNLNNQLLLAYNDVPVVTSVIHDNKYLVLGELSGKFHVFDVAVLFNQANKNSRDSVTEDGEVLKKQRTDCGIKLLYSFDNSAFENVEYSHITSMEAFKDVSGVSYLNVGYDRSTSKIFKL